MYYEIKCYFRDSWGYVYLIEGNLHEISADNVDDLKRKVLAENLPWDDEKVPKVQHENLRSKPADLKGSPASFRLPWCKSNYKRY